MRKIVILLFLPISAFSSEEGAQSSASNDPFSKTDYVKAFDPEALAPFIDVLQYDEAIENLPNDCGLERGDVHRRYGDYVVIPIPLSREAYTSRRQAMTAAVLDRLARCKRDSALRPAYEASFTLAAQGACTALLLTLMPTDSVGGGFGTYALLSLAGYLARDSIKAIYSYFRPGNDPYARWEVQFAERRPYIPSTLWPQIVDTFGAARIGRYSYARATGFFNIAFNLPTMHRYPYSPPLRVEEVREKTRRINDFIDAFFKDYQEGRPAQLTLQAAVRNYLTKLARNERGFVCLHLEGPGGIGKTHFIRALSANMAEVLEQDIPVQEITIRNQAPAELEGNNETPGQVLEALARVGRARKSYGILVFDEASWLNGDLRESAKRMFEPELGSFVSQYLGGLSFSLQGFLIVFLSNTAIEDPALKSRMVHIQFPDLKRESLRKMASTWLVEHLRGTELNPETVFQSTEVRAALAKATTMRDIHVTFPAAVERLLYVDR